MRIRIDLETGNEKIPLEYRRKFLSYIKGVFVDYSQDLYQELYGKLAPKSLCFSIYFQPEVDIKKDGITLTSKRFTAWFTTPDLLMGVHLINAFMARRNKWFPLADCDNKVRILSITNVPESTIKSDSVCFKTLSPIVVRDHNGETKKDWYYSFEDDAFEKILKRNLKSELQNKLGRDVKSDINRLQIKPVNLRKTIVKNYGIYIPCTIGSFILEGERYLLEYLYKAGLGSRRSLGFGLLDIV